EYQVKPYQRDSLTFLAPPELKSIHPLGKSPVIEDHGMVISESGAITEYLINTYGMTKFAPERNTPSYVEYSQWIHFAESSAILPLLLKMFVEKDGCDTNFLGGYADAETMKVMGYFNESLKDKTYLVDERLTGADFMMSFIVEILQNNGSISSFEHIERYGNQLATHQNFHKANEVEARYQS
ncbi:glutathione S-transferase, partial [Vibrio makurazakiensis]|uniref:glutathione S-transferase n=1 Tax=Vibrio makurazakiensis TaxID=2910250 RepID=UPI003D0D1FD1